MMLKVGKRLPQPNPSVLDLRLLGVALEERDGVFMRADLHRCVVRCEVFCFGVPQLVHLLRCVSSRAAGSAALRSPPASAFSSADVLVSVGDHLRRERLYIRISTILRQFAGRYLGQIAKSSLLDEVGSSGCYAQHRVDTRLFPD